MRSIPSQKTPDRVFMSNDRTIARLAEDGRISITDQAAPMLPCLGYTVQHPTARLMDALSALLAQDIRQSHGTCVMDAG